MTRTKLSVEYVMTQQKYLIILKLIQEYSNAYIPEYITIDHLRYKFLDNWKKFNINEQEMLSFFKEAPIYSMDKILCILLLRDGEIDVERFDMLIKNFEIKQRTLDFSSDEKITGDANLKKYLRNLKNLELVYQKSVKKGKPYYACTEKGEEKLLRYKVEQLLKQIPDDSKTMYEIFMLIEKIRLEFETGIRKK